MAAPGAGSPALSVLPGPGPADTPVSGSMSVERTELYWVFTGLATALVLAEIYLTLREFRRNRIPGAGGR